MSIELCKIVPRKITIALIKLVVRLMLFISPEQSDVILWQECKEWLKSNTK
jgi:hypothetical protein